MVTCFSPSSRRPGRKHPDRSGAWYLGLTYPPLDQVALELFVSLGVAQIVVRGGFPITHFPPAPHAKRTAVPAKREYGQLKALLQADGAQEPDAPAEVGERESNRKLQAREGLLRLTIGQARF